MPRARPADPGPAARPLRIHTRAATPADAGSISALILGVSPHVLLNADGRGADEFLATLAPPAIAGYLASPAFAYRVAMDGAGTLAGVVAMRDNAHLYHLFVAPAFHRRGVARRLWDEAREAALRAGNPGEFTVNSSLYAIPVYERFGFRPTGPRVEQHGVAYVPMKLVLAR